MILGYLLVFLLSEYLLVDGFSIYQCFYYVLNLLSFFFVFMYVIYKFGYRVDKQ